MEHAKVLRKRILLIEAYNSSDSGVHTRTHTCTCIIHVSVYFSPDPFDQLIIPANITCTCTHHGGDFECVYIVSFRGDVDCLDELYSHMTMPDTLGVRGLWPVLGAFSLSQLHTLGDHHYHSNVLLPDQPPKVDHCLVLWT